MTEILLTTLNARYSHSSLALRYLYANLHELQEKAQILEYVINENMQNIAEKLLTCKPRIIGISVYIWNASDVEELLHIIKKVAPQTVVVLGGPEASYMPHRVNFDAADYIVSGEGEEVFYELCQKIL
ncbi:MAG: cobalamin-dependent protein, partial [Campylobacterota bacterium]|nr:cobalamin-dependent protein [Campylobacterota bacterium]